MHDEIGGVGFDGIRSSRGANYMREIHAHSLGGERGVEWGSRIVECASEDSDTA